jgi:hypothetical protein
MLTPRLTKRVALRRNAALQVRLARYSEALFVFYANQVPVIFAYAYADNEENRTRGRVGRNSGFRKGVRNQNYVPAGQHAGSPSETPTGATVRYYDLGRQKWRSYRRGNLLSISAFWSEAEQRFVDTPAEAGIEEGPAFGATPRNGKATINEARAARSEQRQATQKQRDADRQAYRTTDRTRRAARRQQNLSTRAR